MEKRIVKGKWDDVEYIFYIYDAKRKSDKIFSVVFFIIKDSNKLEIYKKGLIDLIYNVTEKLPEYNIRIYYDVTSANFVKQFLNKFNVELYMYHFPQFFDKENMKHFSHFGTLIRYLPLFNFDEHKVKRTIIFDIDNNLSGNPLKLIKYFNKSDKKLIYRSRFCYLEDRIIKINMKKLYPIISSLVCQYDVLPKEIFINFINKCLLNECDRYSKFIMDVHQNKNKKYTYGIDEYFMNYDYLNYYIDNNIPFTASYFNYDARKGIVLWLENMDKNKITNRNKKLIDELYKIYNVKNNEELLKKIKEIGIKKDENIKLINIVKKYNYDELNMNKIYYDCILNNIKIMNKILLITYKNDREYDEYL